MTRVGSQRHRKKNLYVNYPLFFSGFNETFIFLDIISKPDPQMPNLTKILPVGAELFHADRQTERNDEANTRFSEFCEGTY